MATHEKHEEKCSSNTDISLERNNLLGEKINYSYGTY